MNLANKDHVFRVDQAVERLDTIDKLNAVNCVLVVADMVDLAEAYRNLLKPRPAAE